MQGGNTVTAYIALGANLGDALAALKAAVGAIRKLPLTRVGRSSSVYKTAPVNTDSLIESPAAGDDYLNAVVEVHTALNAPKLLAHLQQIEKDAGRERPFRNAPRTLDLDLLIYGAATITSAGLTVPHPRMMQRAFVLVPLAEIVPALVSEAQLRAVGHQSIARLGLLQD